MVIIFRQYFIILDVSKDICFAEIDEAKFYRIWRRSWSNIRLGWWGPAGEAQLSNRVLA
jgi:hypothetical protein